ncbi:hypothetical protein B0H16DRAFT_372537 [Mycena metata]|uniref:F-box domain-containing protein n=1 Tax=Mycena metata TaxID=1033252 RepID=A0AAD7NMT1_9AGAR|nr:hypothetical protein B0H16DRAFT_372537 [Mycena metata]
MVLPIGKLPPELLVEIFKIAVHTPDSPISGTLPMGESGSTLRNLLCLSHVSPHWRQIVHGTPQLWAVGIICVCFNRQWTHRYLERLCTFLARSNPCPISVSINYEFSPLVEPSLQILARSLVPTAGRWKNLEIGRDFLPQPKSLPPGTFAGLEWLLIHNSGVKPGSLNPVVVFESPCVHTMHKGQWLGRVDYFVPLYALAGVLAFL